MVHELKIWPGPFESLGDGSKTCEFRKDDRGFQAGDGVIFREWRPTHDNAEPPQWWTGPGRESAEGEYTGRSLGRVITHVLDGGEPGVPRGFCVLSLAF